MTNRKVITMAENNETAIVSIATIMNEQPGTMLCSITPEPGNKEQAKAVFNAMNNPTYKLRDFVNKKILVENVLVEINDIMDEDTGEIQRVPRTVLISPDGTSYQATSKGVFNSIRNAFQAFGQAPWKGGVEFEVKQVSVGRGQMLTLSM